MSKTNINAVMMLRVARYYKEHPQALTVVASRELGISEAEVLRHMPAPGVTELDAGRFSDMMQRLERFGKVHVVVSNPAATVEACGHFGNFSTWGEYLKVQTHSLNMHIRHRKIESAFAIENPSHLDGVPTRSVQFYDEFGDSAFKVYVTFGSTAPSATFERYWEGFRKTFALDQSPGGQ